MFEVKINDYWVKPLIIGKYSQCFFMDRLFDEVSKFEFHEKHIYKTSFKDSNHLYRTAVIILLGEKDKRKLKHKYKLLKTICTDITFDIYAIPNYPLPKEFSKLPIPNYILEADIVYSMEEYQLS